MGGCCVAGKAPGLRLWPALKPLLAWHCSLHPHAAVHLLPNAAAPSRLRNGIRDLLKASLPLFNGATSPPPVMEELCNLFEAACSAKLLTESDVAPFLDAAVRDLRLLGQKGQGASARRA